MLKLNLYAGEKGLKAFRIHCGGVIFDSLTDWQMSLEEVTLQIQYDPASSAIGQLLSGPYLNQEPVFVTYTDELGRWGVVTCRITALYETRDARGTPSAFAEALGLEPMICGSPGEHPPS